MATWPRIQFFEIGDQSWCPFWLREHEQFSLTQLWNLRVPGWNRGSLATQACKVMKEHLPDVSSYTFVDFCAGAGGPSPVMEIALNKSLTSEGKTPVQFILTDLYPHVQEWERISERQPRVSYIDRPVDARASTKLIIESTTKECRIFNICFHHFDDGDAAGILRDAVGSTDAFMLVFAALVATRY
jgi:salicylate hydroxylase